MIIDRGLDPKRIAMIPVTTVQEFRTQCIRILDKYLDTPPKNKPRILMVLDSLGNLSTQKEMEDIAAGKDTRDMTRAQLVKGAFRVITLKLGLAQVPLIVTNHIYDVVGSYVPMKKMGGGCLVSGTKIVTPNGVKEIQDICINDMVNTLFGPQKVTETYKFTNKDVYELEFDGFSIKCSADHKFLVNGKWCSTLDMVDMLKNMKSINISDMQGDTDVYRQQIYQNLYEFNGEGEAA